MDLLPGRLIRCLGYSGIDMQWISHFIMEILNQVSAFVRDNAWLDML
jgi:hypothetical protein